MDLAQYNGFANPKQFLMYIKFAGKALELMQQEIMQRKLGTSIIEFDETTWQKKMVKVFKALQLMERHKQ